MKVSLVGQSVIHSPVLHDYADRLSAIKDILASSDVSFTNLETTIAGRHGGFPMVSSSLTTPTRAIFSPPTVLDDLRAMGFNALSMCNNHAFLLGPGGVLSTIEEVAARGFLAGGLGATLGEAATPGRKRLAGRLVSLVAMDAGPQSPTVYATDEHPPHLPARPGNNPMRVSPLIELTEEQFETVSEIRRALGHADMRAQYIKSSADAEGTVTLSPVLYPGSPTLRFRRGSSCRSAFEINRADMDRNIEAICKEKAAGSFVLVYVHHHLWNKVWERTQGWFREVTREFVDAGADIVVSHGVPVLHGVEIYRGKPIFYSLGNFIFQPFSAADVWISERVWLSVVATCTYRDETLERIDFVPIAVGGQKSLENGTYEGRNAPEMARGAHAARTLQWLKELSQEFGTTLHIEHECAYINLTT